MDFDSFLKLDPLTEATFIHSSEKSVTDAAGERGHFEGRNVGKNKAGHHVYAGHETKPGSKHKALTVHVVHKDTGEILATHAPHQSKANDEATHKAAIAHAKSTDHYAGDKDSTKSFHVHDEKHYLKLKA